MATNRTKENKTSFTIDGVRYHVVKNIPKKINGKHRALAAKDHALDQSKTGRTGHDGSNPFQPMERYGGGYNTAGENCA